MKVTLQVNGREMTFSEEELSSILEEHFSSRTTKKTSVAVVAQKPTEGKWFEVKPQNIDRKLFEKKRWDEKQEKIRSHIRQAFWMMDHFPEYRRNFMTMIPKKTWEWPEPKTREELNEIACKLGDRNADWVEQALEWAQRIANGESWEAICNEPDTANWYRLVIWMNKKTYIVGGSVKDGIRFPASNVLSQITDNLYKTVPLVVAYEK